MEIDPFEGSDQTSIESSLKFAANTVRSVTRAITQWLIAN
jgi:hypothetical protein